MNNTVAMTRATSGNSRIRIHSGSRAGAGAATSSVIDAPGLMHPCRCEFPGGQELIAERQLGRPDRHALGGEQFDLVGQAAAIAAERAVRADHSVAWDNH